MQICVPCNRSFGSETALKQHQQDSPVHAEACDCKPCNRSFGSGSALEQHQRNSPAHAETFDCKPCDRSFRSTSALEQHQRDAPVHQNAGIPAAVPLPAAPTSPPLLYNNAHSPRHAPSAQTSAHAPGQRSKYKASRTSYTFSELHELIAHAVVPDLPAPHFHPPSARFKNERATNVMGNFLCTYRKCPKQSWGSKIVAIVIRGYANNGYSAEVFGQRCKSCDRLGALTLDVQSYVERVAFRLKTWAGVRMEEPPFEKMKGPPHESAFCEGCARGVCRLGGD
ncbi:uncharacterized protein EKO05_0000648 [Ascochyta rabiei]|uniref:uncharacterized protein n=1 Tax=Didymella rabiei TaxID=5454 RepID=UPI0021FD163D|nr:uncharacterized protein EKO05_0000648 [Ascochyta rabiei]UPX09972.1 hypothetical protein EKO05_0000648 [Ascochyta rabiei]